MTSFENKSQLRKSVLDKISLLSIESLFSSTQKIQERLHHFLDHKSGVWGGYQPLKNEPQIEWAKVSRKIEWSFPKMTDQKNLNFIKNSHRFSPTTFGLQQPDDGISCPIDQLVGVVVPAVAYDRRGYRLGRGQGYYDRTLKDFKGLKLGVCFSQNLLQEVPAEKHDISFDVVFTELETVVLRNK